jgi:aminopeptidase 2
MPLSWQTVARKRQVKQITCIFRANNLQYDAIVDETRNAATSDERNSALRSLGRAKSPELIQRTLDMALSTEVKGQDIYLPLAALRSHPDGCHALWKWVKDNWEELERRLPPSLSMLSSVVSITTSSFTHREHIEDIQAFFKDKSTKGFDMSLSQSIDAISAKAAWLERDAEDVKTWLQEHKYLQ